MCIYSQTSKIHSGSGGGQRTKTVSSFYSLEFSTTSSHAGEIGSDVISEKSLPFERQTQRVSPPLPGLLALSHLFLCCLPIGPANGNKSLSQITISSHGLDSYIQSFFHPYLEFFPLFAKGNRKTRKSLWEFQRGFLPIYLNYASFMALLLGWQSYLC